MKQTHSQLHLESVRPSKASHRKKVSRDWLEISSLSVSVLPVFSFFFHWLEKQSEYNLNEFLDKYYEL